MRRRRPPALARSLLVYGSNIFIALAVAFCAAAVFVYGADWGDNVIAWLGLS